MADILDWAALLGGQDQFATPQGKGDVSRLLAYGNKVDYQGQQAAAAAPLDLGHATLMSPYTPTFAQRVGEWGRGAMTSMGASRDYADSFGGAAQNIAGYTPMSAGYDAGRSLASGDYVGALTNALGAIPDVGPAAHAGAAALGGLAQHAIFAGPLARTADLDALKNARKMSRTGADRDAIWDATGWFKTPDKAWKFEIPDNEARFALDPTGKNQHGPLGGMVDHPDLYDAYPGMRDINSAFGRMDNGHGAYGVRNDGKEILAVSDQTADPRDVALHEMQHAVQAREGFARGGNPQSPEVLKEANARKSQAAQFYEQALEHKRQFQDRRATELGLQPGSLKYSLAMKDAAKEWRQVHPDLAQAEDNAIRTMDAPPPVRQVYNDLAGEVEARNVQTRKDMTPEQRKATPPWQTQDVPYDQQLVAKRKSNVSLDLGGLDPLTQWFR